MFEAHRIQVIREYLEVPAVSAERHRVLQVLVNLMRNVRHAVSSNELDDRCMILRVLSHGDSRVLISVTDNGIGIPSDNLQRIFEHGFTTRADGHGFGLHSSARTAKELGGILTAHSAGVGQGATFTLELAAQLGEPARTPVLPEPGERAAVAGAAAEPG